MQISSTMLPDIESVRCFVAAATHLSFRVAAKTVALSPGAFGQRIARLEDELGVRLFERTTRRVALTAAGQRALPLARTLLERASEFRTALRDVETPIPFELSVGTRFELGVSWITPALRLLSRNTPERSLHLTFGDAESLARRLTQGLIDCAVTSSRVVPAGMTYEQLHLEEYVFVAAPTFRGSLRSAKDAPAHTLLDINAELPLFRYFLDAQTTTNTWSFARVEKLGTIAAIKQRALEGAGVAVLPKYFTNRELAEKSLIRLFRNTRLKTDAFRLVWRESHPRSDDLHALARELQKIPLQ